MERPSQKVGSHTPEENIHKNCDVTRQLRLKLAIFSKTYEHFSSAGLSLVHSLDQCDTVPHPRKYSSIGLALLSYIDILEYI